MEQETEREAESQPAVEAAMLDRLLKIEDHVSTMRTHSNRTSVAPRSATVIWLWPSKAWKKHKHITGSS
jgi:hypothetical protein